MHDKFSSQGTAVSLDTTSLTWQPVGLGISEPAIRALATHPTQSGVLFAGTNRALYRSQDYGQHFQKLFDLWAGDSVLHDIFIPKDSPDEIYLATDTGVYASQDKGRTWKKIFQPTDPLMQQCRAVWVEGNIIYVGTLQGLHFSEKNTQLWQPAHTLLNREPIYFLESDKDYLYLATDEGVYRLAKKFYSAEKIFSLSTSEREGIPTSGSPFDEGEAPFTFPSIKFLKVFSASATDNISEIYTAAASGIFYSTNHGGTWERLASGTLPLEESTALLVTKNSLPAPDISLVVATQRGIFGFGGQNWNSLYKGLTTNHIEDLALDSEGHLYAATDRGIFLLAVEKTLSSASELSAPDPQRPRMAKQIYQEMQKQFTHEPTIKDVQRWAIHYAEVHAKKIKNMRRAAAAKAILPKLSGGVGRVSTDYFHWDTGSNPDRLLKGRDHLDWDVSLSWDLGELIWNNDQTSIDSRSKLMVELREDILDQLTRLYFERRRLQVELFTATLRLDASSLLERQMRIDELTALIDGFTGGRFSEEMEKASDL